MKRDPRVGTEWSRGKNRADVQAEKGFTLLEILIALAISTMVMMAIYSVYISHLKSANAQEKIVAMRQNSRAGQYVFGRELMKAGYSSRISNPPNLGFTRARKSELCFSYVDDVTGNLVTVDFDLASSNIVRTLTDGGTATSFSVAEDIEVLEFIYQLKDGTTTCTPTNLDDIRGVRVSLIAKTATSVSDYPNSTTYDLPFPDDADPQENTKTYPSDGLYRQMVTGFYYCRNMGAN